jgi:hypothetical protein
MANSSHLVRETFDDEADDYVMAALLLTMGAALPAWADDAGNCSWPVPGTAVGRKNAIWRFRPIISGVKLSL